MKLDLSDLVSFKEAAAIRGVSVQAIHRLVKRGRLKVVEVSDRKFLLRSEVKKFKPDTGGRPPKKRPVKRGRSRR